MSRLDLIKEALKKATPAQKLKVRTALSRRYNQPGDRHNTLDPFFKDAYDAIDNNNLTDKNINGIGTLLCDEEIIKALS